MHPNREPPHQWVRFLRILSQSPDYPNHSPVTNPWPEVPPAPSNRPVINSSNTASAVAGSLFSYQITASNSPTSYALSNAPAWLSIAGDTVSGTPPSSGSFSFRVTASNADGASSPLTVNLTVTAAAVAPVITSTFARSGQEGTSFSYTITATGSPTPTLSATGLPSGLTFTSPNITGTLPAYSASTPSYNISLTATNSAGSDTQTLVLTVTQTPAVAPVITGTFARSGTENTSFSYTVTATGIPAPVLTVSGLPTGLTYTAPTISGTLPAYSASTPSYNISLTATNSAGTDNKTLVLTVTQAVTPSGWEVTYNVPSSQVTFSFTNNGHIPLISFTGWQAAYAADVTDDLYNATSMATLPVNLLAKYIHEPAFLVVPFDNWSGNPTAPNRVSEWGYDSSVNSIYISGNNGTGSPIQLKLVKT